MLVLFETAAGYALFKLLDEKKLKHIDKLYESFEDPASAKGVVQLKQFKDFKDTTEALAATVATIEGKVSKPLKKMLKQLVSEEITEDLAVADAKLGNAIKEKFNIPCVFDSKIQELMSCIRSQAESLISRDLKAMVLGLAHSLSRYKLKFTPDKVDTMVVQAVGLLDDLDKELNNYTMRAKEWYGWHFPELAKILGDNVAYVKTVLAMGTRDNVETCDFSEFLPAELEEEVKKQADKSVGSDITEEDINQIKELCQEVMTLTESRAKLFDYLRNRMNALAPNLSALVGEMVGARLIAHAGSLMNLSKHPASTVQILGAEKALFRALKTKHDTPKYGLIYHSSLVGQANQKNKGKISRMLAAKAALATRVDALGEDGNLELGVNARAKLECRLKALDEGCARKLAGSGKAKAKFDKYENKSFVMTYNDSADSTLGKKRKKHGSDDETEKPKKKKMKKD